MSMVGLRLNPEKEQFGRLWESKHELSYAQLKVTGSGRYYTYSQTMDMLLNILKDGTGSVYGSKAPQGGEVSPPFPIGK